MAFRLALTTLFLAALCSSSMARVLRAADPEPAQNQAKQNQPSQVNQVQQQFVQPQQPQQFQQFRYFQQPQPQAKTIIIKSQVAQPQPFFQPQPVFQPQPSPIPFQAFPVQAAQPAPAQVAAAKSAASAAAISNNVPSQQAQVTAQSYDFNPVDNSFSYAFQTNNGIAQQAKGYVNQNGNYVQEGSYTLYTPEGIPVSISYIADENGYQAVGDAIPQPDPIIAKAIAYQRSLPPSAEDNKQ